MNMLSAHAIYRWQISQKERNRPFLKQIASIHFYSVFFMFSVYWPQRLPAYRSVLGTDTNLKYGIAPKSGAWAANVPRVFRRRPATIFRVGFCRPATSRKVRSIRPNRGILKGLARVVWPGSRLRHG
jgi:hypothetical protein